MSTAKKKRTWREKLADSKDFPKVVKIDASKSKRWGTGTFVIPAPLEVDALMKTVRRGKLTTMVVIRRALAIRHKATIACPMTTGIFPGSPHMRQMKTSNPAASASPPIGEPSRLAEN
jgi:hypothetical protein